ncbi:hypothetical protein [Kozakia baliensis]|uniref:hypothetical protein n=1 Tax=Kozakia baliensis TaxID=153496 RepID=UPI0004984DA1|nr:hypothetical protein [Kozakia baliensis]
MRKEVTDSVRLPYLNDPAFWRRLMRKLMTDLRALEDADRRLLAKRPERLEIDFAAIDEKDATRTAELKEALRTAKAMPDGWFSWTTASKRKTEAITDARRILRAWQFAGRDKFTRAEFASIENKNRRRSRKIADFDARPDVREAKARLAAMPGVLAEAEGAGPDEYLYKALSPVVSDSGRIVRIHPEPAFDLLRVRAAKAAAMADVPGEVPAPEPVHTEKAGNDARPALDDGDILDALDALN